MSVNERLKAAIKALKRKGIIDDQQQLADELGYKRAGTISDILKAEPPNTKFVKAISTKYGIDERWILTGEGVNPTIFNEDRSGDYRPRMMPETIVSDHILPERGIPLTVADNEMEDLGNGLFRLKTLLVDQKSAAGYLTGWGDQEYLGELKEHTVTMRNPVRGTYRSFQINDNNTSMYNPQDARSIAPRDIVTGRMLKRDLWRDKLHYKRYPFWVIVHRIEGITTKEIVDHNVKSGIIQCHSLNPDFEDFPLFLDDVIQLFNVIKVEHDYL